MKLVYFGDHTLPWLRPSSWYSN